MCPYVAFLRGINVSGKNKISMNALKLSCEQLGLRAVKTYLNSGNVLFSTNGLEDPKKAVPYLTQALEELILQRFELNIPVYVLPLDELSHILHRAPPWWGTTDKAIYDNLIFVLPPTTPTEVTEALGAPHPEWEKIHLDHQVIFWSFHREQYRKTYWWAKTAKDPMGKQLTIRTANTVKKLVDLAKSGK